MRCFISLCGILSVMVAHKLSYNEAVVFKMTNLVCQSFNESWFVFYECRLRAISRNKTVMRMNSSVLHPVDVIHLKFQFYQRANGYKPWIIGGYLDCCRFLKKPFNIAAILIFKLFGEFSNINHTCPFMGPQVIDGFYLKSSYLPHTFPTADYLLAMNWSFDRRVKFMTNVYFEFKEDL